MWANKTADDSESRKPKLDSETHPHSTQPYYFANYNNPQIPTTFFHTHDYNINNKIVPTRCNGEFSHSYVHIPKMPDIWQIFSSLQLHFIWNSVHVTNTSYYYHVPIIKLLLLQRSGNSVQGAPFSMFHKEKLFCFWMY